MLVLGAASVAPCLGWNQTQADRDLDRIVEDLLRAEEDGEEIGPWIDVGLAYVREHFAGLRCPDEQSELRLEPECWGGGGSWVVGSSEGPDCAFRFVYDECQVLGYLGELRDRTLVARPLDASRVRVVHQLERDLLGACPPRRLALEHFRQEVHYAVALHRAGHVAAGRGHALAAAELLRRIFEAHEGALPRRLLYFALYEMDMPEELGDWRDLFPILLEAGEDGGGLELATRFLRFVTAADLAEQEILHRVPWPLPPDPEYSVRAGPCRGRAIALPPLARPTRGGSLPPEEAPSMSVAVFSEAVSEPERLCWRAPEPGRGWSPLPDPGEGPLTEEDLYLWRFAWDLRPEEGHFFLVVEDHPTQRQYVGKEELGFVELEASWAAGDPPRKEGPGGLLVKLTRFGQAVEFLTFAGRDGVGVAGNVFVVGGDDAANQFADSKAEDPGAHCLAWGGVRTPGPEVPAALWLERGVGELDLAECLAGLGQRLEEEAGVWAGGDRRAQRQLLARLIDT
jgi:hypothetical protein